MYKIMSLKEKWSELNQPHLSLLVPFTLCVWIASLACIWHCNVPESEIWRTAVLKGHV
jgi:hypothetical protein